LLEAALRYGHEDNLARASLNAYRYDPWGGLLAASGTYNPYMYAGTYNDHMLGLYQMGARYYQPGTGRFTQADPLPSSVFTANRYGYTPGNPANYADPSGLAATDEWSGGGVLPTPSYAVAPDGTVFPVPEGATAGPPESGEGIMYTGGKAPYGMDRRVTGVRFMGPSTYQPYNRAMYMNAQNQTVNPWTGDTIARSHPFAHIYYPSMQGEVLPGGFYLDPDALTE
jgi:RHS repeat-associated protein